MPSPHVTTCTRCSARAHKVHPAWWKRWFLGFTSQYLCAVCKHRFFQS